MRGNNFDQESAKALAKIGTEKGIMLFGIKWDQKEADFQGQGLGPVDAILLASDLANSSLSECNVRGNNFDSESAKALAKIGTNKRIMLFGIKRDKKEANLQGLGLGPADGIFIASDLVNGLSCSLTLIGEGGLDLRGNSLGDEGWGAILGERMKLI